MKTYKPNIREALKTVGYFDGRFAPKQFTDKKKQQKKFACRKKIVDF